MPNKNPIVIIYCTFITFLFSGLAHAESCENFPKLDSKPMPFGDGTIVNRRPRLIDPPAAEGVGLSNWSVLLWRKSQIFKHGDVVYSGAEDADVVLGPPDASWGTRNSEAQLRIWNRSGRVFVGLLGRGGWTDSDGGSDIMIKAQACNGGFSLERDRIVSFKARVVDAHKANDDDLRKPLVQLGAMLISQFRDPESKIIYSVMLGIPVSNSVNSHPDHRGIHFFGEKRVPQIVANQSDPVGSILPFEDSTHERTFDVSVSRVICKLVSRNIPYRDNDRVRRIFEWPQSSRDLRNWSVQAIAFGVETMNGMDNKNGTHLAAGGVVISDFVTKTVEEISNPVRCG